MIGSKWCGLGVVCLVCVTGCKQETPPPQTLRPVRTMQVAQSSGVLSRTFSGVAKAGLETDLSFKVAGTVTEVTVDVGDRVEKDQLIAELDPEAFELRLQIARSSLQQAQAQARNAEANYQRVQQLWENNNASRSDLDVARANSETAQAMVETSRKQLELAQLELSYTRLLSPFSGAVAQVMVEANENLRQGQAVVKLTSDQQIEVQASIPEALITRIQKGDTVTVRFDAVTDKSYEAKVTEVGVKPTDTVTTFPVTVRLVEPEARLRSGMAAEITFRIDSNEGGKVLIPPVAAGQDRQGRFVFLVEPAGDGEGIVRRRSVQVGTLSEAGLEILDGLVEGDRVVTAGISRITDGQRVKLDPEESGS